MNEIIREINDDLRKDKISELWENFGSYIMAISAIIILGTIGNVVWQGHKKSQNEDKTTILIKANNLINANKKDEAKIILNKINDVSQHKDIANLLLKKIDSNIKNTYNNAHNKNIYSAYLNLNNLDLSQDTAFFNATAQEMRAIKLFDEGKKDEAIKILQTLKDSINISRTMRARAESLILAFK